MCVWFRLIVCAGLLMAGLVSDAVAFSSPDLLANGSLAAGSSDEQPAGWASEIDTAHGPETQTWRSASTAWSFSGDGSIHQDVLIDVYPGDTVRASGYLLTPEADALRGGDKCGMIELAFFSGDTLLAAHTGTPVIAASSPSDAWIYVEAEGCMPSNTTKARVIVRCANGASGSGRFIADDLSVTNRTHLPNLLLNSGLRHVAGLAPENWLPWDEAVGPDTEHYITAPNGWAVWDEGGIYQDVTNAFAVGDTLMFGYWVLQPSSDPFDTMGPASQMRLVFYNAAGTQIENNWAMPYLKATNTGANWSFRTNLDEWVFSHNRSRVPANAVRARIEIRQHSWEYGNGRFIADNAFLANLAHESNVLVNPVLHGDGESPSGWRQWNEGSHGADTNTHRSPGNSWAIWWDGGIYQDAFEGLDPTYSVTFGAWLQTPGWDALRNGAKSGVVELRFYAGSELLSTYEASNSIHQSSARDTWTLCEGGAVIPEGATAARLVVYCRDAADGNGRFFVDDVYLRSGGPAFKSFTGSLMGSYGGSGIPRPYDKNYTNYMIMDAGAHFSGDGRMLRLWGCNWKWVTAGPSASPFYEITANTILEFDFMSDGEEGEINGVGLAGETSADMSVFAPRAFFQIYGTETFSNQTYHNYPGSGWRHYEIPVGHHTTGNIYGIVIANQATNEQATSVYFRNLRFVENYRARAVIRDSDVDGCSDWHEWIAGTDEMDGTSKLIVQSSSAAAHDIVLQWPSASNRTYSLYRSENLPDGFAPIATDLAATPPGNAYTDTVSAVQRVYYRIQAKY